MNSTPPNQPDDGDELLCHCLQVTRCTARAAIAAGVRTLEDLQRQTGACTGCHTCYVACQALLSEGPREGPREGGQGGGAATTARS